MSLRLLGLTYVTLAVAFEAVGQLALKHGAERARTERGLLAFFPRLWRNWSVGVGILCFMVEAILWTMALRLLDVSIAFPAGSLCFVLVLSLSRFCLHEQVGVERWIGAGLILSGVILLGLS